MSFTENTLSDVRNYFKKTYAPGLVVHNIQLKVGIMLVEGSTELIASLHVESANKLEYIIENSLVILPNVLHYGDVQYDIVTRYYAKKNS